MRREETGGDTGGSPEDAAELRVPHPELHRVQHRTVPGLRAHCSERRLRFLCLPRLGSPARTRSHTDPGTEADRPGALLPASPPRSAPRFSPPLMRINRSGALLIAR